MAQDYTEYAHIKIYLSDVLLELDDAKEAIMRSLLRIDPNATEDCVKQELGVAQGVQKAVEKLKATFGAL